MGQKMLTYNGRAVQTDAQTVMELLHTQGISNTTTGIAVAKNATLVPRKRWGDTPVRDGDTVEVVKPFQGG